MTQRTSQKYQHMLMSEPPDNDWRSQVGLSTWGPIINLQQVCVLQHSPDSALHRRKNYKYTNHDTSVLSPSIFWRSGGRATDGASILQLERQQEEKVLKSKAQRVSTRLSNLIEEQQSIFNPDLSVKPSPMLPECWWISALSKCYVKALWLNKPWGWYLISKEAEVAEKNCVKRH